MFRSNALQVASRDKRVPSYTVAQAAVITGVPVKLINTYLDRELESASAIGAGFRAVRCDSLLAIRLNFEHSESLSLGSRLEVIRQAMANPRSKWVKLPGDQVSARVDVARSVVNAGVAKFRIAASMITSSDDVLGGEPCIKGTRLSAYLIRDMYKECGRDEVRDTYPDLSDREIDAACMYADMVPRRGRPRSVGSRLSKAKPTRSRVIRAKPAP